ncbi:TPA: DUF882 domain-containing protein [Enterobacter hormaechei subsp. xiangfangensis]|nr:DUF882 domain-containing protein [Enterobacter hormaechei subsp. xiangfangensis]HAV1890613.1 DUF882 domain-containing protein [Enterobacter hormaechei subsp. xiangfangensis]
MGDLSEHFNRREFACKCSCGFADVSPELVKRLEKARVHFNAPITINSGCRCARHNKNVGGLPGSQHVKGTAADIVVKGVKPSVVADWFEKTWPDSGGVGRYASFTHVDVRPGVSRWRSPHVPK